MFGGLKSAVSFHDVFLDGKMFGKSTALWIKENRLWRQRRFLLVISDYFNKSGLLEDDVPTSSSKLMICLKASNSSSRLSTS